MNIYEVYNQLQNKWEQLPLCCTHVPTHLLSLPRSIHRIKYNICHIHPVLHRSQPKQASLRPIHDHRYSVRTMQAAPLRLSECGDNLYIRNNNRHFPHNQRKYLIRSLRANAANS